MEDLLVLPKQWESWRVVGLLGTGSFAKVYLAEKIEYGERFLCAIKHISISNRKQENLNLYAEGIASSENDVSKYCGQIKTDLIREIKTNYEVRGNSNIVCYSDHIVEKKPDGSGYDVYIMMEYLKSLSSVISERTVLNTDEIMQIGIDICSALEVLGAKNIIHRDIKPGNIFINREGIYKLGDFGVAKVMDKTTSGMSIKGTVSYMAPEIFLSENVDKRSDIYSLGLVLYRLLNNNKPPFVDPYKLGLTHDDNTFSFHKRVGGERLPYPSNCSNKGLTEIIMKACEYRPDDRWQNASDMKEALLFLKRGGVPGFVPINPVYNKNANYNSRQQYRNGRESYQESDNSNLKLILSGVIAVCAVIIISSVLILTIGIGHKSDNYIDVNDDFVQKDYYINDTSESEEKVYSSEEESKEQPTHSNDYDAGFATPTTPTEKKTEPKTEETTESQTEKKIEKEAKVCYADVECFLTVRKEADSTSQAIVFIPPLTSMTIIDEQPINGMLLILVDATQDVGYVNTKYLCYSRESAKDETKNSLVTDFFYPQDKYIYIAKETASIYDIYGYEIDVLQEDELVYIVDIIDSDYTKVLFLDTELPYYCGIVENDYLEQTDGC